MRSTTEVAEWPGLSEHGRALANATFQVLQEQRPGGFEKISSNHLAYLQTIDAPPRPGQRRAHVDRQERFGCPRRDEIYQKAEDSCCLLAPSVMRSSSTDVASPVPAGLQP